MRASVRECPGEGGVARPRSEVAAGVRRGGSVGFAVAVVVPVAGSRRRGAALLLGLAVSVFLLIAQAGARAQSAAEEHDLFRLRYRWQGREVAATGGLQRGADSPTFGLRLFSDVLSDFYVIRIASEDLLEAERVPTKEAREIRATWERARSSARARREARAARLREERRRAREEERARAARRGGSGNAHRRRSSRTRGEGARQPVKAPRAREALATLDLEFEPVHDLARTLRDENRQVRARLSAVLEDSRVRGGAHRVLGELDDLDEQLARIEGALDRRRRERDRLEEWSREGEISDRDLEERTLPIYRQLARVEKTLEEIRAAQAALPAELERLEELLGRGARSGTGGEGELEASEEVMAGDGPRDVGDRPERRSRVVYDAAEYAALLAGEGVPAPPQGGADPSSSHGGGSRAASTPRMAEERARGDEGDSPASERESDGDSGLPFWAGGLTGALIAALVAMVARRRGGGGPAVSDSAGQLPE